MSNLTVDTVTPRTTTHIDIEGVDPPTYLGSPLAIASQVLALAGGTLTGPLILSANATAALEAIPKQQLETYIAGVASYSGGNIAAVGMGSMYAWVKIGAIILNFVSVSLTDIPAGSGTTGTVAWPTPFTSTVLFANSGLSVVSGNPSNVSTAVTSVTLTDVSYQVQEWASATNPVVITLVGIGV